MKIKPEFCTPFYYGHPQEDSKERYELIQEELLRVHYDIDYEIPKSFPHPDSHSLNPDPFNNNLLKQYKCDNFIEFLKESVSNYFELLRYQTPPYIIEASWLTKNAKGTYAPEHTHGSVDISGVYYLKTTGDDGDLYFKNPTQISSGNRIMKLVSKKRSIKPVQGLLLMWPGYLSHGTYPNETDSDRVSLSFNIICGGRGFVIDPSTSISSPVIPVWSENENLS